MPFLKQVFDGKRKLMLLNYAKKQGNSLISTVK